MHYRYRNELKAGSKAIFTVHEYAENRGIPIEEASKDLKAYQAAQRAPNSPTFYVITRVVGTRTSNAEWRILNRIKDAKLISMSDVDDMINRIEIATIPDLKSLAQKSPRSKKPERIGGLLHAAAEVMRLAAQGISDDE